MNHVFVVLEKNTNIAVVLLYKKMSKEITIAKNTPAEINKALFDTKRSLN